MSKENYNMKIKREVLSKMLQLLNWVDEVLEEEPFSDILIVDILNHDNEGNKIYLVGKKSNPENKILVSKSSLIFDIKLDRYSDIHPTKSFEYFIDINLYFRPRRSSEDWTLPEDKFKVQVRICLNNACTKLLK